MEALKLPNTLCLKCDVTNYAELENCIKEGEKKFGPVDLLVNNAGVMYLHSLNFNKQNFIHEEIKII